ncbi:uncharacterized protein AAG666_009827 isoform 1-T3 [Megaptera novaeangliae]
MTCEQRVSHFDLRLRGWGRLYSITWPGLPWTLMRFRGFFSDVGYHRILSRVPCATQTQNESFVLWASQATTVSLEASSGLILSELQSVSSEPLHVSMTPEMRKQQEFNDLHKA